MNSFSSRRTGGRNRDVTTGRPQTSRFSSRPSVRGHHPARRSAGAKETVRGLPAPGREYNRNAARSHDTESDIQTGNSFGVALRAGLFSLPVTLVIGLIFLLIAAGVAYVNPDPDRLLTPLGLCALGLCALCGGFVSARRGGCAPVLCSAVGGVLFGLCLFLGSLILEDAAAGDAALSMGLSSAATAGLYVGITALEIVGALIGRHR